MKIYLTVGMSKDFDILTRYEFSNILASYVTMGKWASGLGDYFLDSGAFAAFTRDVKIDIHEYIEFIKKNEKSIRIYAALDVIGDAEASKKNYDIMKKAGLDPIPTFHFGGDLKILEYYCENSDYIALGGLVPLTTQKAKMKKWLSVCWNVILPYLKKKKIKVHAFGVLNPEILACFPFYSADGSSWKTRRDRKAGQQNYRKFLPKKNQVIQVATKNATQTNFERSVQCYVDMENYLSKLWKVRGLEF